MKKSLIIFLLFVSVKISADEALFTNGNNLYINGNYSEAILKYDSILSNNIESHQLYYNLGNCYYKTKDWANAIWYYEKSLKIEKDNKTIQNLTLVNLKIIDKIEPLPELFYKRWFKTITQILSLIVWQKIALICIWCFLIFKALSLLTSAKTNKLAHIFLIIGILTFFISNFSYANTVAKKEGIIFSSTVIVNSAPTSNSTNLFSLHTGVKVEIVDEIQDWINIKLVNGNTGWIKKNHCKIII